MDDELSFKRNFFNLTFTPCVTLGVFDLVIAHVRPRRVLVQSGHALDSPLAADLDSILTGDGPLFWEG